MKINKTKKSIAHFLIFRWISMNLHMYLTDKNILGNLS